MTVKTRVVHTRRIDTASSSLANVSNQSQMERSATTREPTGVAELRAAYLWDCGHCSNRRGVIPLGRTLGTRAHRFCGSARGSSRPVLTNATRF